VKATALCLMTAVRELPKKRMVELVFLAVFFLRRKPTLKSDYINTGSMSFLIGFFAWICHLVRKILIFSTVHTEDHCVRNSAVVCVCFYI